MIIYVASINLQSKESEVGSNSYCTKCHHWFNPTNGCLVCQKKKQDEPETKAPTVKYNRIVDKILRMLRLKVPLVHPLEPRILGTAEELVKGKYAQNAIFEMTSTIKESKHPEYIVQTSVKVKTPLGGKYDEDSYCCVTIAKDETISGRLADDFAG